MKNYSFTIVIPVYNAEKYIGEMIDTVLNQTYTNWNLILVDDGSTDQSGAICDRYKCNKVFVVHNKNMGQVAARIDGIKRATGDYTLVLDADDTIHKNYLEKANEILNKYEYDVVMFPYEICDAQLNPSGQLSSIPDKTGKMTRSEVLSWIIKTTSHGLVDKVIRTSMIKKGALEAPAEKLKINGDYALIIPIICQIDNAYFSPEPMYSYRVLSTSTSHAYNFQQLIDTDFVSSKVEQILINHGIYDVEFKKLVNIAYLRMLAWMTEGIIERKQFNAKDFKELKNRDFYKGSIEYEKRTNMTNFVYYELKIIRKHINLLMPYIKFCGLLKKIKHIF
ncbi:MAG: glycosyltransferase family 2 protein [Spirochaetaceae bacterium]|nr:glycosyltransferase family 2 protein [Spirochaetaceae bacterium]